MESSFLGCQGPPVSPPSTPELCNSAPIPEMEQHKTLMKQQTLGRITAELE